MPGDTCEIDALAHEAVGLQSRSTRVEALGSLEIQKLMGKPQNASHDDYSKHVNCNFLQVSDLPIESVVETKSKLQFRRYPTRGTESTAGNSSQCSMLNAKHLNNEATPVIPISTNLLKPQNATHDDDSNHVTCKFSQVADIPIESVEEAKSTLQSRRYPTRGRASIAGNSSQCSVIDAKHENNEANPVTPLSTNLVAGQSLLTDSALEAKSELQSRRYPIRRRTSASDDSPHGKNLETKYQNEANLRTPHSTDLNAGNSKRKLQTVDAMPSHTKNNKGTTARPFSWLQDPELEKLCSTTNEQGNEIATEEKNRRILQLFRDIHAKISQAEPGGRVDLLALKLLKDTCKFPGIRRKSVGSIPGVEVGDCFHCRVELSIVGLHPDLQAGIGCAEHGGMRVAASIVSSGRYGDNMSSSDILVFSGSGGHAGFGPKDEKRVGDQKLQRGNLALKNSIDAKTPVRVIYGYKEEGDGSIAPKAKKLVTYIYDGLYLVEKFWSELGSHGFSIFKFQLRRMPSQPKISIKELTVLTKSKEREGLCVEDISQGKEPKPICAVNNIDSELPMPFTYTIKMIYPPWYKPTPPRGCDCTNGCSDLRKCACVVKNGGEIPFNREGAIVEAKPLVYECGPSCKCPPSCHNRVTQHGIRYELEIFKTKSMGWGVRSLTYIPSGSFICEYVGEMLEEAEADRRKNDEYLFDIGKNYHDQSLWEGLSTIPDLPKTAPDDDMEEGGFTVDAANYGNVGRFINHSCTPNLYAQNLLHDHDDISMPHVMLFASENITPLEELTYHYNYSMDRVQGPDGTIKKKDCYCGSIECTGRLY